MEENREILIFSNKKRIKQQHEQKSLCSQRISELPDFHSMTHLQSKQYLSSYHNHKHISLYKRFHICDGIYHIYMYMPVAIIFRWYVLCNFGCSSWNIHECSQMRWECVTNGIDLTLFLILFWFLYSKAYDILI